MKYGPSSLGCPVLDTMLLDIFQSNSDLMSKDPVDEVILRDTCLYYLFAYDVLTCIERVSYVDRRSNGVDHYCLDHDISYMNVLSF